MTTPDAALFAIVSSTGSDPLRLAVAAHLSRYQGLSRVHADSDPRAFLTWCLQRGADPRQVSRPQVELYVRWMQEIRRYKPSTVSRRLSVMTGFYRTCVIDGVLPSSPAEHVRHPNVPPESPTLGLTHLQFEAILTAARLPRTSTTSPSLPCSDCSACGSSKPAPPTSPTSARNTATASSASPARAAKSS
jgi:hypothetical protein